MARTLTIDDDDWGVATSVRIDNSSGTPLITDIRITASAGQGITSEHLLMLQDLGLRLPEPGAAPAAPPQQRTTRPRKAAAAKKPKTTPKAAAKANKPAEALGFLTPKQLAPVTPASESEPDPQPAKSEPAPPEEPAAEPEPKTEEPKERRYHTGGPPPVYELQTAFQDYAGNHVRMAQHFEVSASTITNWIRKAREAGATIKLTTGSPHFSDADAS